MIPFIKMKMMMTMNNINDIMKFVNEACERNYDINCYCGLDNTINIKDNNDNEVSIYWGNDKEKYIDIRTSNLGFYEFENVTERDLKILELICLDIKEYRKNKAFDFINKFFPEVEKKTIDDLDDDN